MSLPAATADVVDDDPATPKLAPPHAPRIPREYWRVFAWLFWGDFVLMVMEQVVPGLVPIMLHDHGFTDLSISVIMGTIPTAFTLMIMPLVSYRSDQLRTRWGRRIPFLVVVTPLIVVCLAAIPFSPDIAGWIERAFPSLARLLFAMRLTPLIAAFTITVASYSFFNSVVSASYSYLLPDVVPRPFMGRFLSIFRVVGVAGVFVFNHYCMRLAQTHAKEVFAGAAIVYGLGFLLVCLKVKEPSYPPPTEKKTANPIAIFLSYARECFRHPMYRWFYLAFAMYGVAMVAPKLFDRLFLKVTLGMDLGSVGDVVAWSAIAPIPIAYFCGQLLDRWNAQRAIIPLALLMSVVKLCGFFVVIGPKSYIALTIVYNLVAFFWSVTYSTYMMSMLPKDRYGQFVYCNAFVSGIVVMAIDPLCGLFFRAVNNYRFVYLWSAVIFVLVAMIFQRVNRYWIRCGGPDRYQAP